MGLYSYHSAKIFLPLLLIIIYSFFYDKKKIFNDRLIKLLLVILFLFPFILTFSSNKISNRLAAVNLFKSEEVLNSVRVGIGQDDSMRQDGFKTLLPTRLIHNKATHFIWKLTNNFYTFFGVDYLFLNGGKPARYKVDQHGLLLLMTFPFLLLGLSLILKDNFKIALLLMGWLMIAIIPGVITYEDFPHVRRTLEMLTPLTIFIAYGGVRPLLLITNKWLKIVYIMVLTAIFLVNFVWFVHYYSIHSPFITAYFRSYGYKSLVDKVDYNLKEKGYNKAIITSVFDEAYIFFLFYSKYDPLKYQQISKQLPNEISGITWGFDNLVFSTDSCPYLEEEKILFVGKGDHCLKKNGELEGKQYKKIDVILEPDRATVYDLYSYEKNINSNTQF